MRLVLVVGFRCWIFIVTRTRRCSCALCSLRSASIVLSTRVALSAWQSRPGVNRACATTVFRGRKCCAATNFRSTTTSALVYNITATTNGVRRWNQIKIKQSVALTGRNMTGPPCSVGPPTAHVPGWPARRQCYRRRQTTTDASQQNNTGPLSGPVIKLQ